MSAKASKDIIYAQSKAPWIGGPGTRLPWFIESFMSWTVALSMLGVSGYHYIRTIYVLPTLNSFKKMIVGGERSDKEDFPCWLEVTTSSRAEKSSEEDRYKQLVSYLQETTCKMTGWTSDELVKSIRGSEIARRLVSLALRPAASSSNETIQRQLLRIWPYLLRLPPPDAPSDFKFDVSVILPAYRERGTDVLLKLNRALKACQNPSRVEIVVVDAGDCVDLNDSLKEIKVTDWGSLRVVKFADGGGRGPCLNYGASQARGRLYAFVHSDTTLPPYWDAKIIKALDEQPNGVRANSCTFSFGIDTSEGGLNGGPLPPGIKAVETTANWRTHLYSLPYGDQTLSVPAVVFKYVGGFPDQCLMEDYELVSLLRRRSALLPTFGIVEKERLVVIGGIPAYCSPRRWQKFGILHVTFMNSKLVNLYAGGMSPDELFTRYYGRASPQRSSEMSPWEEELEDLVVDEI